MSRVFLLGLAMSACSYSVPYEGPPGQPSLDGIEHLWPDINGKWRRETLQLVTNPNYEPLDTVLECDPEGHHGRKWPGSRLTLHVPPRTTIGVLLHPHDHLCSLLPVEP